MRSISILLPTRGRKELLIRSLHSLALCDRAGLMNVIIACDDDVDSMEEAMNFSLRNNFNEFTVLITEHRAYSVKAFIAAYNKVKTDLFFWTNDECLYKGDWLFNAVTEFEKQFPDDIGVLSLWKKNKAGLGITSKKFVEYNNNEWFWNGYQLYYSDDELACRAILLGRYKFLPNNGITHDLEDTIKHPIIPLDERTRVKKTDRQLFYNRTEINFGISPSKMYKWEGFRDINLELKG